MDKHRSLVCDEESCLGRFSAADGWIDWWEQQDDISYRVSTGKEKFRVMCWFESRKKELLQAERIVESPKDYIMKGQRFD